MIEESIFAALSAAVSPHKVYPSIPGQDQAAPFLVYAGVQTDPILNLQGEIKHEIEHFEVNFHPVAKATPEMASIYVLAETVKAAIHNQMIAQRRILFKTRTTKEGVITQSFRVI